MSDESMSYPILSITEEEALRKDALLYPPSGLNQAQIRAWLSTHQNPPEGLSNEDFNLWLEDRDDEEMTNG